MRYLLDTNHASPLVTPGHPVRAWFDRARLSGAVFHLDPVVRSEVRFGLRGTPRAAENLRRWSDLLPALTPVALRHGDAELAADLRVLLRARGRQLALADALIAAVALRLDLTLLTRDRDFVAVPGLASEDWSTPQNDSPTRSP